MSEPQGEARPMRFAYADPPYHGMGKKLYRDLHPDAADWDDEEAHTALVDQLVTDFPDGWALSCNPRDLPWLLLHCPTDTRVCAWVKTWHQIRPTSVQYAWEPVLLHGGRKLPKRNPMVRDWYQANATRMTGTPGAKPQSFNRWILDLLGYEEGDELVDLFPGSGGMERELSAGVLL